MKRKSLFALILFAIISLSLFGCGDGIYGGDEYQVFFETNSMEQNIPSQKVTWGDKFTMPSDPIKKGYTFSGWYLDELLTISFSGDLTVKENMTLYAKWSVNKYTITFDSNGGSSVESITGDYDSAVQVTDPVKEGYTFDGWYLSNTEMTTLYKFLGRVTDSDITLYAKWNLAKFSVVFDSNGGSNVDTIVADYMSEVSLPSPTKEGYTFGGWYLSNDFEGESLTKVTVGAADTKLYAKWNPGIFTISYFDGIEEIETLTGAYNEALPTPSYFPLRTGYTFIYFGEYKLQSEYNDSYVYFELNNDIYTQVNLNETTFEANKYYAIEELEKVPSHDAKVFAAFVYNLDAAYTVEHYKANLDLTGYEKAETENLVGKTQSLTNGSAKAYEGFTAEEVNQVLINADGSTVLKIYYTRNIYTITYKENEETLGTQKAAYGATLPNILSTLTKVGYTYSLTVNGASFDTTTLITSDLDVEVLYTAISGIAIQFAGYDNLNIIGAYGDPITLPTLNVTGYDFDGWYDMPEGNDEREKVEITTMPLQSMILYPSFTAKEYTYEYFNNGNKVLTVTEKYGEIFTKPGNPIKDSTSSTYYYFIGWSETEGDSTNVINYSGSEVMGAENKTFYAVFGEINVSFKYVYQNEYLGKNLYTASSLDASHDFDQYVLSLYKSYNVYLIINDAINEAIKASQGDTEASQLNIALIIGYFTYYMTVLSNCGGDVNTFIQYNAANPLSGMTLASLLAQQGIIPSEYVVAVAGEADKLIPLFDQEFDYSNALDISYINAILQFQSVQEAAAAATSDRLFNFQTLYFQYKDNAYVPFKDGYVFDGWGELVNQESQANVIVYKYAKWVKPIDDISMIRTAGIGKHYVTLTWDEVKDAWGYRIEIIINDNEPVVVEQTSNQYKIEGLEADDYVTVKVKAYRVDSQGQKREFSDEFTHFSFEDPSITLKLEKIDLKSVNEALFNYTHTVPDVGEIDDTKSSNYYYREVVEEGSSDIDKFYFFANTHYSFNVYKIVIVSGFELVNLEDNTSFSTGSDAGMFSFKIYRTEDDTEPALVEASISLLPEGISLGNDLFKYSLQQTKSTFLKDSVDTYLIGAAKTTTNYNFTDYSYRKGANTYYNGYKFDFVVMTTSGYTVDSELFDLEYHFFDEEGKEMNAEEFYIYDESRDVFYFLKQSGKYKVVAKFKADNEDPKVYTNVTIPKAYKNDPSKDFQVEFNFELNDGINVYSNESMKAAFNILEVQNINIHTDIEAKLSTNQVGFIPYLYDKRADIVTDSSHGYKIDLPFAEYTLVDGTAVMSQDVKDGPRCYRLLEGSPVGTPNYAPFEIRLVETIDGKELYDYFGMFYFTDVNGNYYAYDKTLTGTESDAYAIKTCEFKAEYNEHSYFKVLSETASYYNQLTSMGLMTGSVYLRTLNNEADHFKVNGNYFTIDGSKLPFCVSSRHVESGFTVASYFIQGVCCGIIEYSANGVCDVNNLNVIGNTMDASSFLSGNADTTLSIADYMSRTSGGYNGIKCSNQYRDDYAAINKAVLNVNNCNVSNTLIAVYPDFRCTTNVNYTHIKQTWANSIFSSDGAVINVKNSYFETSGGAAVDVEDHSYTMSTLGHKSNPIVYIDFANTNIENFVSGEEPWFKGYSMEVLALGMKSKIDNLVSQSTGGKYTVINTVIDPTTKLETEKMNFVFLAKNDDLYNSNKSGDLSDITVELAFGTDTGMDQDGSAFGLGNLDVLVTSNGDYILFSKQASGLITIVPLNSQSQPDLANVKLYLYFEEPSYCLQGIIQVFEAK